MVIEDMFNIEIPDELAIQLGSTAESIAEGLIHLKLVTVTPKTKTRVKVPSKNKTKPLTKAALETIIIDFLALAKGENVGNITRDTDFFTDLRSSNLDFLELVDLLRNEFPELTDDQAYMLGSTPKDIADSLIGFGLAKVEGETGKVYGKRIAESDVFTISFRCVNQKDTRLLKSLVDSKDDLVFGSQLLRVDIKDVTHEPRKADLLPNNKVVPSTTRLNPNIKLHFLNFLRVAKGDELVTVSRSIDESNYTYFHTQERIICSITPQALMLNANGEPLGNFFLAHGRWCFFNLSTDDNITTGKKNLTKAELKVFKELLSTDVIKL
jgi:acyl carrier protein